MLAGSKKCVFTNTVSTTDNINFTGMTCFPLQFSRLARTSIRRSVALVRSGPPLETAIAPLRGRRKDRQRLRQSSLSVMNAGDQACPETRPCPHPSSGSRNQLELLLEKRMVRMCYSQTSSPCGAVEHSCSSVRGKAFCCDSRYVAFVQITQQLELLLRARTPYN